MDNIDFEFIKQNEGFELQGYVPVDKNNKPLGHSGVTIASGFDLGQRCPKDISGFYKELKNKLIPYLGLQGEEALEVAHNLCITEEEGNKINNFAKRQEIGRLQERWYDTTGSKFELLPSNKATVIASVAFQYGNLKLKTPKFWAQITSDDWEAAYSNLLDFGDRYPSRRKREAEYLKTHEITTRFKKRNKVV